MKAQEVLFSEHLEYSLEKAIVSCSHDKIFILVDTTTDQLCLPLVMNFNCLKNAIVISVGATDTHKTLETLVSIWTALSNQGASRHSLFINIGGGMITDLGGFAASTFKRGIPYINIPTTLLAMVDASVGGKTGINFNGLKNEIGVFCPAHSVIIDTEFLKSLDAKNIRSGFAEMLKHGLISNMGHWTDLINFNLNKVDYKSLQHLIEYSIKIKENIVTEDPHEYGIRKALNLGHTIGHAFESLALAEKRPILHGYAVAYGIVCELYASCVKTGFPKNIMQQTINFIKEYYGIFFFNCKEYDRLYEFMKHDKKNEGDIINFTLLNGIGNIQINQTATQEEIYEMFDFYRETMGC